MSRATLLRNAFAALVILATIGVVVPYLFAVPVLGTSMTPTLDSGDRIVVNPFLDADELDRFDVVSYTPPQTERPSVKRVIGLPGDEVRILDDGRVAVRVDGTGAWYVVTSTPPIQITSPRPCCDDQGAASAVSQPVVVPAGFVWLLGDNPDVSIDSRDHGWVDLDAVSGRIRIRVWPLSGAGRLPPGPTLTLADEG